jgi:predicted pyridoxine 5'-phosphate oxidase superfamily flavin-nucleotide-binding protein
MGTKRVYSSDVAFTDTVKALQQSKGSRRAYARMEEGGSWETRITPALREFVEASRSMFLATANREGQPYIQHRGGPPGFLRVLDDRTLGFADFAGNRQYITLGNLAENSKAHLFLIDYAHRRRIKIWGEARTVEDDAKLVSTLMPEGYRARAERAVLFTVVAWDSNCPQHIPRRFEAADVEAWLAERDRRIASLEAELAALKSVAANHDPTIVAVASGSSRSSAKPHLQPRDRKSCLD